MANQKRMISETAVSPIVATLVLIVVAVIGAVAVGTIMGTFSTDVSKNVNANQAAGASQTEIVVSGPDPINSIVQTEGAAYIADDPGIKIVTQASSNDAGVQLLGNGIADIGEISGPYGSGPYYTQTGPAYRPVPSNYLTKFPDLQNTEIGVSFVVPITNHAYPVNVSGMEFYQSDFRMLFNASGEETFTQLPEMAGTPVSVIRGDHAPIAVAFAQYLSIAYLGSDQSTCANPNTTKVTSDQQMVATVGSTPYAVGYADYNDAVAAASGTNPTIDIMDIPGEWGEVYYWKYPFDTPAHVTANWNVLRNVAQAQYTYLQQGGDNLGMMTPTQPWWDEIEATNDGYTYPAALFRAHYFVTEGQPDSITQNFISYVLADKEGIFQKNNMWSMKDIYS